MARRLDLRRLKRTLNSQQRLPKDLLIKSSRWRIQNNPHRNRDRRIERAFLHALTSIDSTGTEQQQALAQANCSPEHPCGYLNCWLCKHRAWRRLSKNVHAHVGNKIDADDLSWITIVIGVSKPDDLSEIANLLARFRCTLQGVSSRLNTTFVGRYEIDLIRRANELGTFKLKTLKELGYRGDRHRAQLTAVVHVHLIGIHPSLPNVVVSYWLKKAFPGFRRTAVKPLDHRQSLTDAVDNLSRYMLKSVPPKTALFHRGSRLCKPQKPKLLRHHNRILLFLRGRQGDCVVE
jgi:hypothetical protein